MNSLGLRPSDIIYAPIELPVFHAIAALAGARHTHREDEATIWILFRPAENELISHINKLEYDRRIVAYNEESQIDGLSLRSFEMATACLFDQESKKVVRVFDAGSRKKGSDYLHVELGEHSDSSLSIYASRIAALR
jgi:hypothetical protein